MDDRAKAIRRQVIRRVRYATNALALEANRIPPEGPFDTALTNGLLAIVSAEWPDEKLEDKNGQMPSARALLNKIETRGGLDMVDVSALREGLDLTQPFRHGRADDEFAGITDVHVEALFRLDEHWALRFIDTARGKSLDECCVAAYYERASEELPFDPKDRLDTPDPEECDVCWRMTFLPSGWDMWGGTNTAGFCIACGYERTEDEAYELAASGAIDRHLAAD